MSGKAMDPVALFSVNLNVQLHVGFVFTGGHNWRLPEGTAVPLWWE